MERKHQAHRGALGCVGAESPARGHAVGLAGEGKHKPCPTKPPGQHWQTDGTQIRNPLPRTSQSAAPRQLQPYSLAPCQCRGCQHQSPAKRQIPQNQGKICPFPQPSLPPHAREPLALPVRTGRVSELRSHSSSSCGSTGEPLASWLQPPALRCCRDAALLVPTWAILSLKNTKKQENRFSSFFGICFSGT